MEENLEKESLLALQSDPGWLMVCGKLNQKKEHVIKQLCAEQDLDKIRRAQIKVEMIEYLLNCPRLLLQELKQEET